MVAGPSDTNNDAVHSVFPVWILFSKLNKTQCFVKTSLFFEFDCQSKPKAPVGGNAKIFYCRKQENLRKYKEEYHL